MFQRSSANTTHAQGTRRTRGALRVSQRDVSFVLIDLLDGCFICQLICMILLLILTSNNLLRSYSSSSRMSQINVTMTMVSNMASRMSTKEETVATRHQFFLHDLAITSELFNNGMTFQRLATITPASHLYHRDRFYHLAVSCLLTILL